MWTQPENWASRRLLTSADLNTPRWVYFNGRTWEYINDADKWRRILPLRMRPVPPKKDK